MDARFTGKRVLVTGGARGIGAATARAFHAEGAKVAIAARTQASVDAFLAAEGDPRYGGVAGDLSTREACHRVVGEAIAQLGGLDVLVNSAGIFEEVPFEAVTQDHWDETIRVNLGGVFFCSQAAISALMASRGNIVNVASDAGLIAYSPAPAYCASKGGVVSLTRTLAYGYARSVRVNCVCPGNVDTDMLAAGAAQSPDPVAYRADAEARAPMGRMATPEEVAQAILYLASEAAGFTTGVALPVDGGGLSGYD